MDSIAKHEEMENKKPTLQEVKDHFKCAETVKSAYNGTEFTGLRDIYTGINGFYYCYDDDDNNKEVWNDEHGYAEIVTYKQPQQNDFKEITDIKVKNPKATNYKLWDNTEVIDVIKTMLTEEEYKGFLKGNLLKYRLRDKGQDESDKEKAKDYQNELNNL